MTIVTPDGPELGYELVERALGELAGHPRVEALFSAEKETQASPPLAVYTLQPRDIDTGAVAKDARPTAWRYLIGASGNIAMADIQVGPDGHTLRFGSLTHGFSVERLHEVLLFADRVFGHEGHQVLRLGIVEFPALYCAALWLRPDETPNQADTFIPYLDGTPDGPALEPMSSYLAYLKDRLHLRLSIERSDESPSN